MNPAYLPPGDPLPPEEHLLRLLGGKWVTAAVSAAARLGLAEQLIDAEGADRPADVAALAGAMGCDGPALERLLRVLAGEGLLDLDDGGRYRLTPLGRQLHPDALGHLAAFVGLPFMWDPWARLAGAIRSGRTAFELAYGSPLYPYLDGDPEAHDVYHRGVDAFTRHEARALAERVDLSDHRRLVDVGGGLGTASLELARAWPHLEIVLFDRPGVVEQAAARFAEAGVSDRCRAVGGDFFGPLPPADAYLLKHVVHNWDDPAATRLLAGCRAGLTDAAEGPGMVLVVEGILLPGVRRDPTRLLDLEMLVLRGAGRERSKGAFRRLFADAGLTLGTTWPLAGATRLLVGRARV